MGVTTLDFRARKNDALPDVSLFCPRPLPFGVGVRLYCPRRGVGVGVGVVVFGAGSGVGVGVVVSGAGSGAREGDKFSGGGDSVDHARHCKLNGLILNRVTSHQTTPHP